MPNTGYGDQVGNLLLLAALALLGGGLVVMGRRRPRAMPAAAATSTSAPTAPAGARRSVPGLPGTGYGGPVASLLLLAVFQVLGVGLIMLGTFARRSRRRRW